MTERLIDTLAGSVRKLLRPLVRVLLRHGIPHQTFAEFAKQAYVDVAAEEFAVEGRKPSELVEALGQEKIAANHGHFYAPRCLEGVGLDPEEGVLRISMVHYNTLDEVDRVIGALENMGIEVLRA